MMSSPHSDAQILPSLPDWLERSAAFLHPDARIFKAHCKLLIEAGRGSPVGSVPAGFSFLAQVTGVPEQDIEACYAELTEGFVLVGERFYHDQLAKLHADPSASPSPWPRRPTPAADKPVTFASLAERSRGRRAPSRPAQDRPSAPDPGNHSGDAQ